MYEIQTEDFYKDISVDVKHRFDTSKYSGNHSSGIPSRSYKKVIGMFKDEGGGDIIDKFVGLRAKLYSYIIFEVEKSEDKKCDDEKCENEKCEKCNDDKKSIPRKCKGIKKSVIKKSIAHEDYKQCLSTGKKQLRKMNAIRSDRK